MGNVEMTQSTLVTDFDGTLTQREFYGLIRERLLPPDAPDYWTAYNEKRITHFEALRGVFGSAEGGEPALISLTRDMQLQEKLAENIAQLAAAGWDVAIVSAGCSWYIERLLTDAGVQLPLYTNVGRIENDRLVMEMPRDQRFLSQEVGIDKAAVVRWYQSERPRVAFAGDGLPDLEAALLVPPELRFARRDLAHALRERGETFQPFEKWADVVQALTGANS